jgi:hypothetical protein
MKASNIIVFIVNFLIVSSFIYGEEIISLKKQKYIFERTSKQTLENIKTNLDENSNSPIEIVGWSKDGLLAYRRVLFGGDGPGVQYDIVIFNPIDDRVIEEDSMVVYSYFDEEFVDKMIIEYKTKWNLLLKKYNIIGEIDNPTGRIVQTDFLQFPMGNFDCWFDYTINKELDKWEMEGTWINWKLIVGNDKVQKIINTAKEQEYVEISGRKILGYIKNPYANRIVVLVNYFAFYFGPRGMVNLYGCNMDVGLN